MRVLFDTNLCLNYLLSPDPAGTAVDLALAAAADGVIELLLPEDVVTELATTVARRPYLASRIEAPQVHALLGRVRSFATSVPPLDEDPPAISRDPHDDYLVALAVLYEADYLVTRDRDLLILGHVRGVSIINPGTLLGLLRVTPDSA